MLLNGLVLRLIDGPAHRLMPRAIIAISYTGPVSGRAIRLPAQSARDGNRFLVVAGRPETKRWWRSFRDPHPARLVCDGLPHDVTGHVLTGAPRDRAVATYLAANPRSRRGVGPRTPVIAFDLAAR